MSRCGVQFEITNHLQRLKTNDGIVSFLNVLVSELEVADINSLLIKIFFNIKHQVTDESLNNILHWLRENSISNNSDNHEPPITKAKANLKSQCQFEKIPNDVLCHIGSYLCHIDTIKLSQTNHSFHKKIHNKSFINSSNDYDEKVLKLSEKRMSTICKTRIHYANLSHNKWEKLVIGDEIDENSTIHCSKYNKCSFCRVISQVDEYNNYDLQWFAKILSNVQSINLSNNWPCLWNKMPLKWLLRKDKVGASNVLELVNTTNNGTINNENGRAFAEAYESYFMNECQSDSNKIREIGSINFGSSIDYCIRKMCQNYTSLICEDYNTLKCQTLSDFLTIVHQCVDTIGVEILDETDFCKLFFDESSDIYKDINTDESIFSLESFKSKWSIYENMLPRIEAVNVNVYSYDTRKNLHKKLLQVLSDSNQDSKLISILNLGESLKCLELRIFSAAVEKFDADYHSLIDIFSPIIDNFNQIERIQLVYGDVSNGEEQFDVFKSSIGIFLQRMESFIQDLHFEPILYKILYRLKSSAANDSINNFDQILIGSNDTGTYFADTEHSTHTIKHTIIIDDIKPPFVDSCQKRAKMASKQILEKIRDEKTRRIKCPKYNVKSIDLIIEFRTEHNL